jgi:GntR family transcriptional regulator
MSVPESSIDAPLDASPKAPAKEPILILDSVSYVPFYEQIVEQIRAAIKNGSLIAGQEFRSEGEVARDLGISKMPVRQAFQKLRSEGLLVFLRGKKPVIGTGQVPWDFQELRGFSEEMRRRGLTPSARVLSIDLQNPGAEAAQELKLSSDQKVYRLKRLRFVEDNPVAVVTSYLPAHFFPGIEKLDLSRQSLYHVLETIYKRRLHRAEERIGAINAGHNEAHILDTSVGSALMIIHETTYDIELVPVEYSVSLLRADRYTAFVASVRKK